MLHYQGVDANFVPITTPIYGSELTPVDFQCSALVQLPNDNYTQFSQPCATNTVDLACDPQKMVRVSTPSTQACSVQFQRTNASQSFLIQIQAGVPATVYNVDSWNCISGFCNSTGYVPFTCTNINNLLSTETKLAYNSNQGRFALSLFPTNPSTKSKILWSVVLVVIILVVIAMCIMKFYSKPANQK